MERKEKELENERNNCKEHKKDTQKELERCDKRFKNEREYSKEKVEDIYKQSEELSFVRSDLGEYKTSYNFTWYTLITFIMILCGMLLCVFYVL